LGRRHEENAARATKVDWLALDRRKHSRYGVRGGFRLTREAAAIVRINASDGGIEHPAISRAAASEWPERES
jgi:hypothetical protein